MIKTNRVCIKSDQDKSMISHEKSDVDESQDTHRDYLNNLMMRPLVEFKKLLVKAEGDTQANGINKYKESKQKESALEALSDENIEAIINGRK